MKLASITWGSTPRMPGLRPTDTGRIDCDNPNGPLKDWRVVIRGSQIFFVSPPGWNRDQSIKTRDPQGPRVVFGPVTTNDVYLEWVAESEQEVQALVKGKMEYESPPFGWRPAPIVTDKPILDQIPAGQMGDA